jgi:sigma-E factor negative regulatory protein RseC
MLETRGCGSGKLTQLFCSTPRQFKVDNRIHADVGEEVVIAVPDGAVLRGISLVYLLPLVMLFAGATLAGGWSADAAQRDAYAATGALTGLVVGFLLTRWFSGRVRQQPFIARRVQDQT